MKWSEADRGRLHYLFTEQSDTKGAQYRNNEISGFFLYKITPPRVPVSSGDIRFNDSWRGTWLEDAVAEKQWIAKSKTYKELRREYEEHPEYFCDALSRCLSAMRRDQGLVDTIESLLRETDEGGD
jgi:hypothetical protein